MTARDLKSYKETMATQKPKPKQIAVFALIDQAKKEAIERLARKMKRSIGFLVREAVEEYLAKHSKRA